MGRPLRMTPQREEAILQGLRLGLPRTVAAQSAGVGKDTLRRHCERKPAFRSAVDEAEAQSQSMLLGIILKVAARALPNTWQAAAWMLERRWPELYGRRVRLGVKVDMDAIVARVAAEDGLEPEAVKAELDDILALVG